MNRTVRPLPGRRPAAGPPKKALVAGAAVAALLLLWILWPSSLGRVANLDSRGATIIAFGDSLTAGYGAGSGEDYPSRLSPLIGATIVNAGVSGDTTSSALERLERDVLQQDPRIVIVGLGGNDFLRRVPIATTEANLRAIIERIQAAGAMVVLLGFRFPSLQENWEKMYERVADDTSSLLIPDLLDGILSDPSLKSDEIHPNTKGYALMAERIAPRLRKLVEKADRSR